MFDWYELAYFGMIGACWAGAELLIDRTIGEKKMAKPPDIRHGEEVEEIFFDAEDGEEVCDGEEAEESEEGEVVPVVAILLAELKIVRQERDRLRVELAKKSKSGTKRRDPPDGREDGSASEVEGEKKRRRIGGEAFFSAPPIQQRVPVAREFPPADSAPSSFVFQSKENILPAPVEFENPFLVKEETPKVPAFVGSNTPATPWCENKEPTADKETPENPNQISDRPVQATSLALVCADKNSAPPPSSFHDDPFFSGEFAEGYGGKQSGACFHDEPFFHGEYAGYGEGQYAASFDDDPYYEGDYREEEETDSFDDDPFYEGDHAEEEEDTDSFDDDPFYEGGSPEEDS